MAERQLAKVALSGLPFAVDRLYTYEIPPEWRESAVPGVRVIVPFGNGNRHCEGFIMQAGAGEVERQIKPILSVIDAAPLLEENLLRLIRWMKARYFCTYYDAIKTVLPAGLWLRVREWYRTAEGAEERSASLEPEQREMLRCIASRKEPDRDALREMCGGTADRVLHELLSLGLVVKETSVQQKTRDKSVRLVSLALSAEEALASSESGRKNSTRRAAVEMLCTQGTLSAADLSYYTGVKMPTLRALEKAGIVCISEQEVLRVPKIEAAEAPPIRLNEEQRAAFEGLLALTKEEHPVPALLHGVTASGKTQVYLSLIQEILSGGRTALVLVPEIALTPQMMAKFTAYFGSRVAMLHSDLRLTERYDQWKRICRGEVDVVLGTRSAVFAPLPRLGLIVMDEEQEPTYQSENPPRYHTRDVASFRSAQSGALLLLGSATPTVETAYSAETGRYQVFKLYSRYNRKSLPQVQIADLRQELRRGNGSAISEMLRAAIAENLERGEQSILFLNRRGSARMLLCAECGSVPQCPRCSVPMTYHSANHRLMCHYCGHSQPAFETCPDCGGRMKPIGFGTQKVEEELHALFPGVGVLRMDTDTVGADHRHEELLRRFEQEKIPILLGTQMVAKGLDFENVTLVGVLSADLSLYVDNYHAAERTFCLLSQVVGRAGRGSKTGRAVIQTYTPENDVICAAARQDYDAFYRSEMRLRRLRRYPPFADLITLTVTGDDEGRVLRCAAALRDALRLSVQEEPLRSLNVEVLGPAGAPVVKVNNRYRYRVFLVGPNGNELRRTVTEYLLSFPLHPENRGMDLFADCNALQ